jgi:hypothetical protein
VQRAAILAGEAAAVSAIISPCGLYRYRLERELDTRWGASLVGAVIMVNPSTADAELDDHTIRKLRNFGFRWGWKRLIVGNLFAYRSKDVRELGRVDDPVGPENDPHLVRIIADCDELVFAWGPVGKQPKHLRDRYGRVCSLAGAVKQKPMSIGAPAKDGHPKHPLMLAYNEPLQPWTPPA